MADCAKKLGRPGMGVSAAAYLALAMLATAGAEEPRRGKLSPLERMTTERLKATHEGVQRVQQGRRAVPAVPGLNDYRCILHAHAEDSAHTGGTRPEMLAEARAANVQAILLTDHHRPPRDFVVDSWRGIREGVLFLPGSEDRGFLLYPTHSILDHMQEPTPTFIETVRADGGLIFLSHVEERPEHSMDGLDGLEIYNRHYDAKVDAAGVLALVLKLTDPGSLAELKNNLARYPDALFAAQVEYPVKYLAKWDAETRPDRRLTGVAANDCHHNQVLLVKMVDRETVRVGTNVDPDDRMRIVSAKLRPGIRALTEGHQAGDVLARVDLDPYHRSFANVSTHVLAPSLDEAAIREALRNGHAYVSHDWMCDPTGFRVELLGGTSERPAIMGDQASLSATTRVRVEVPARCRLRLLSGGRVIDETVGDQWERAITAPGVYRLEAWLDLGVEERCWIYANPIYVR